MAIITARANSGLEVDSRWKQWAKKADKKTVDLEKKNGYSLIGAWVGWNEAVALNPGEYLICASEVGSRANKAYKYCLLDHEGKRIGKAERAPILERAPEEQRAKAINSTLYAYALYIARVAEQQPAPPTNNSVELRAEREKLVARLAEIDALLAAEQQSGMAAQ